jgi:hypothetical protein
MATSIYYSYYTPSKLINSCRQQITDGFIKTIIATLYLARIFSASTKLQHTESNVTINATECLEFHTKCFEQKPYFVEYIKKINIKRWSILMILLGIKIAFLKNLLIVCHPNVGLHFCNGQTHASAMTLHKWASQHVHNNHAQNFPCQYISHNTLYNCNNVSLVLLQTLLFCQNSFRKHFPSHIYKDISEWRWGVKL